METIRVNMTPCEDIKTIHASQNDNEAREWGFELHNNGEKIDSSSISDQLVFKAYEGGTEQILPENGSTPTTSPFKGDIRYPQGLLTDQEFFYRESPTEEDGLAWIKNIKGNTLVWNQLIQNGNFADTSNWNARDGATLTASNNVGTLTTTSVTISAITSHFSYVQNHKYLLKVSAKSSSGQILGVGLTNNNGSLASPRMNINPTSSWKDYYVIGTATEAPSGSPSNNGLVIRNNNATAQMVELKNVQVFDLTAMGLDSITTVDEFTSLFPLPYYDYNQGTLIPFSGNGIKTVGKNQLEMPSSATLNGLSFNVGIDGQIQITGTATAQTDFYLYGASGRYDDMSIISSTYTFSCRKDSATTGLNFFLVSQQLGTRIGVQLDTTSLSQTVALDGSDKYRVFMRVANGTTINTKVALQLELGASVTDYEPYTSSTLSLPISTYFPTGMDGVGTAYDELTSSKATTRMDRIDLGSITYTRVESQTSGVYFFVGGFNSIPNIKVNSNYQVCNIKTPLYETVPSANIYLGTAQNKTIGGYDGKTVRIRDDSFTDATAFKNSLSGQYLVYELVTPTETSFTTASLVTENAEIPLSAENDVLVGKCTEQISSDSGFFDAKIKLSDSDGECYSNKIQLHIERSPQ